MIKTDGDATREKVDEAKNEVVKLRQEIIEDRDLKRKEGEDPETYYKRMRHLEMDVQGARREAKRARDDAMTDGKAAKVGSAVASELDKRRAEKLKKDITNANKKVEAMKTQVDANATLITQAEEKVLSKMPPSTKARMEASIRKKKACLLYTSDAADE